MDASTEATVSPSNHVRAADSLSKAHDAVGNEFRVFKNIGCVADDAWNLVGGDTASGRASNLSQTASASRIRFVIASGCEISARWLASISIVFARIRLAMNWPHG